MLAAITDALNFMSSKNVTKISFQMMTLGYGYLMSVTGFHYHETSLFTGPCGCSGLNFMMNGEIKNMLT